LRVIDHRATSLALIILHSKDHVKNQQKTRDALDEYRDEVAAFANQRLLGNKAFVKKLITTEPSTAEKLIAKIREIRENLMIRNPSAKAQLELVKIKESPASRATIRGTPTAEPETELPTNRISQNPEKSNTKRKKTFEKSCFQRRIAGRTRFDR
jgi:hypothetical protein